MTQREHQAYWCQNAAADESTMHHLLATKDNTWALFLAHLVLEKRIKAVIAGGAENSMAIPRTHDLLLLCQKANLNPDVIIADILDAFTAFNIQTRYPDYQQSFYTICDDNYVKARMAEWEVANQWLSKQLLL